MTETYCVTIVDGSYLDVLSPDSDSIRFDGLSWAEVEFMVRLATERGLEVVLWRGPDEQEKKICSKAV